jgi:hypothetical protein
MIAGVVAIVIRIQATVLLRCQGGVTRRVRIVGLSASRYGRIAPSGRFAFTVRVRSGVLRRLQIQAKGRFDVAGRRARGTLRVTGSSPRSGRCDSRPIAWTTRLVRPAP